MIRALAREPRALIRWPCIVDPLLADCGRDRHARLASRLAQKRVYKPNNWPTWGTVAILVVGPRHDLPRADQPVVLSGQPALPVMQCGLGTGAQCSTHESRQ